MRHAAQHADKTSTTELRICGEEEEGHNVDKLVHDDSRTQKLSVFEDDHGPRLCNVPMKYISLVSLTLQTSAQVFVIKWAKAGSTTSSSPYLASTIVFFTELTKVVASMLLVARECGGFRAAWDVVSDSFASPVEVMKMSIPALLYIVQNNLMFFSLSKLSMAVQQVTYQLKILTTAILSVLILGKVLSVLKWIALLILLLGVSLIQWPRETVNASPGSTLHSDAMIGFVAVLAACFTSGFASVWLEKLLKHTSISIWVRNVQLGAIGSVMALLVAMSTDGTRILDHGLCQGYTVRVFYVILTNSLGGLLCAAVLKYADNILRCFSTALSIVLTCTLSAWGFREFSPDDYFMIGTILALFATFLYSVDVTSLMSDIFKLDQGCCKVPR
jgi:UDP-sugar transporter A1/2/3